MTVPEKLEACIHCGFCLSACPTYTLWGKEADSPRGRIHLMRLMAGGEATAGEVAPHLDSCLGCLACTTACPSGVEYGELLEDARAELEASRRRPLAEAVTRSLVFSVFPFPARVRLAVTAGLLARRAGLSGLARRAGLYARLPVLRALDELLPEVRLAALWAGALRHGRSAAPRSEGRGQRDPSSAGAGRPRLRVGLLTGCVQRVLLPSVNDATRRVLEAEGCEVVVPGRQGCCGALELHEGRRAGALGAARATVEAFEGLELDFVVVNAAGCGAAMKEYGRLLAGDPRYARRAAAFSARVRDVSELLAGIEPRAPRNPLPLRVAYHDACHLAHGQGLWAEPRSMLGQVPGLEIAELAPAGECCGSAGVYNLLEPEAADALGAARAAAVLSTGATVVAAGNPGCALQLRRHLGGRLPVVHPVELIDASISG